MGDEIPEDQRERYEMAFSGHGRGLVIDQVDGKFTERTMTPGELMARQPAMKIAEQIHKLARYAAFAYIKCWEIIAPVLSDMTADRDRSKSQLSQALRERDELSADLLKLREATRVRPSKKAMVAVRETLEAMEAMDEEDAPALRLLVEMYDKLEASA